MINRLACHPQRTHDPTAASLFVVPVDVTHNTWDGSKGVKGEDGLEVG